MTIMQTIPAARVEVLNAHEVWEAIGTARSQAKLDWLLANEAFDMGASRYRLLDVWDDQVLHEGIIE